VFKRKKLAIRTLYPSVLVDLFKDNVMGCTELPLLIKEEDSKFPLIATKQLHAQLAADFILGYYSRN
jgi:aspartate/glutamate racemase